MPTKKKAKAPKTNTSKATRETQVSQFQKISVRADGGMGGSMPASIVYATYAHPSPILPTQFIPLNRHGWRRQSHVH